MRNLSMKKLGTATPAGPMLNGENAGARGAEVGVGVGVLAPLRDSIEPWWRSVLGRRDRREPRSAVGVGTETVGVGVGATGVGTTDSNGAGVTSSSGVTVAAGVGVDSTGVGVGVGV